jgi:hypothetical protein
MTTVCLQCGEFKTWGAACPACGYLPVGPPAQARQFIASERYHSHDELEDIARRVKAGEAVEFPPGTVSAGFTRQEILRLTSQFGTVPPPWVVYDEHPY